jgi:putative nucleotidyltransferase with HDIG domain
MNTMVAERPLVDRPWYLEHLTPFPGAAIHILRTVSLPDVSVHEVAGAIRTDTVFAGRLLKAANSPLFGIPYEIESIERAAAQVGLDYLAKLAVTVGIKAYLSPTLEIPATKRCWRHSLACALLAEELAPYYSMPREASYTAGLLHDIGRLALVAAFPKGYSRMLELCEREHMDILACERELLGSDHCAAGLWVAVEWKLPSETFRAIWDHHDTPDEGERSLTAIVHAACQLADALGFGVIETHNETTNVWVSGLDLDALKERVAAKIDAF